MPGDRNAAGQPVPPSPSSGVSMNDRSEAMCEVCEWKRCKCRYWWAIPLTWAAVIAFTIYEVGCH